MGRARTGNRRVAAAAVAAALAAGGLLAAPADAGGADDDNQWLGPTLNLAHAGGIHEAPQNTLYAFETAAARGADVIEVDLQITADGHVVAMHDSTLDRTTDGRGCVVAHTLAEVQRLDAADTHVDGEGPVDGRPAGDYRYRGVATGAVPPPAGFDAHDFTVPTLEEIFEALPRTRMNLEIKAPGVETVDGVVHDCRAALAAIPQDRRPDIVAEVARLIDEHDVTDRVLVASFSDELLHAFAAAAPDVATSFPLGEGLALHGAFTRGETPANPHGHDVLQAPMALGDLRVTADLVAWARDHGIAVHVWTVNDPEEMRDLIEWGADGIITDRPQVLAGILDDDDPDDDPDEDGGGDDDPGDDDGGDPPAPDPAAQSPFLCTTEFQGLGQPVVDNQERRGTPVYPLRADGTPDREAPPLGWSERCQAAPKVEYRYRTADGSLRDVPAGATQPPADVAYLDTADLIGTREMDLGGATRIPYVIRYERGTLPENRFLYSIAMLVPWEEVVAAGASGGGTVEPSHDHWNRRLVFSFSGGVGIGHSQGTFSTGDSLLDEALRLGHAVLWSSGTRTSVHYNLALGGRTALEAKELFVERHGRPRYTVGIGGSGGGIQQYVYAQNHPGLLDALIPQYSYPDMTTQTIHIGDCELLEHYMDVIDAANPRWRDWDQRKLVEGLNTIEGFTSEWQARTGATGSSECIEGWRGATPLAMNPTFGFTSGLDSVVTLPEYLPDVIAGGYPAEFPDLGRLLRTHEDPSQWVEWTHFADVAEVYGIDPETGLARVPWDNVGVQYGLRAVADGSLTPQEFLDLNARIGGWKEPQDAVLESCALAAAIGGDELALLAGAIGMCEGNEPDWWSARQMTSTTDPAVPAPRREGDVEAIRAAFEQGLVFRGDLPREVPIIDARHYLEDQLDMHNAHQSFAVRERIRRAGGDVDNHVIWFLDARPQVDDAATARLFDQGFRVMDEWMRGVLRGEDVDDARPEAAADSCWATDGTLIASGDDVWDGALAAIRSGHRTGAARGTDATSARGRAGRHRVGACTAAFPLHSTSRIVAGGPVTGDVYKCHTKPVEQAIRDGDYGVWEPTRAERARLRAIFPDGVCDYSRPSVGDPRADHDPDDDDRDDRHRHRDRWRRCFW
ncbi:MAG: hypothetical protein KatS3mg009_0350 [Acidimicrobiia bacterium]|nr:MAG: hypothetical protein KatS3mg009_0350 [Acidimicrobiia bacterium]